MHEALAEAILKNARLRLQQGDCPTAEEHGRESLEMALVEIADQRDRLRLVVAHEGDCTQAADDEAMRRGHVIEELRAALLPCVGWLEYAYRNVDSATATAVKAHLPTIRAVLAHG